MFILKDTNKWSQQLSEFLRDWEYNKKFGSTWFNVARWSFGIRNCNQEIPWNEINDLNHGNIRTKLFDEIKNVCAINIKKGPGGKATKSNELYKAVEDYGDLIKQQINLYNANYIILCGVGCYYQKLYNIKNSKGELTNKGIYYLSQNPDQFTIWYYHPNARFPNNFLFYSLVDAVKELEKIKSKTT